MVKKKKKRKKKKTLQVFDYIYLNQKYHNF